MSQVTAEMIERGRSAPESASAAHRRRNAQQMRNARERLTSSGSGQRTFDLELMRSFIAAQHKALMVRGIAAVASVAAIAFWISREAAAVWLVLVLVPIGGIVLMRRRFHGGGDAAANHHAWKHKVVAAELVLGVAWSALAVLFKGSHEPAAITSALLSLVVTSAMASLLLASVIEAVYAALLPATLGILLLMTPSFSPSMLPQMMLACSVQIVCVLVARKLHSISLTNLFVQSERDASIIELEQARLNSDEARRRAEEANLAKSRFLATMSHELRTPLNAILGFSEVMKSELFGAHSAPIYKEYSQDVYASGEHLLKLINEILDLSRVEAGRYDLSEEPIQFMHIVEDCMHLLKLRANKRQITLRDNIERGLPRIWADERAIRQVVLNLLSNAIKFTPQGGTVTITLGRTPEQGQFVSIKDTGPGIPAAEIPIVMASFGRGTLAQKNAEEGSGLGLPIVKGLVELHGGAFSIRSKVREGTEVTVALPPERVIDALPRIDPDRAEAPTQQRRRRQSAA